MLKGIEKRKKKLKKKTLKINERKMINGNVEKLLLFHYNSKQQILDIEMHAAN